ncbi:MAG: bifunctional DNA-formamidopyrimidine glycosylase/DNA-(apurinic or apyrimidinic site) lyase [Candidatus Dormibacteria bacterium]
MPELPEVETVVRDLRGALTGRRIETVDTGHAKVFRTQSPEAFAAGLRGTTVVSVSRRGKYIVVPLDSGDDLVVHLGMTGHLLVCTATAPVARHTHLRCELDDGRELRFDDARRFGRVLLGPPDELIASGAIARLGVEPLSDEFSAQALDAYLRRTTRQLKAALLDQRGVAGLGNIYVDESCHRARVRPTRRCHTLTRAQRAALFAAIPVVLNQAIVNRGTTFDDFRDLWDARGGHLEKLQVYGRGGQPCYRCGHSLRRTVLAGRTTVYCARCQA